MMRWIYENNETNTARFLLGKLGDPLICFGVNPSIAEPQALDPTMKSVEKITKSNGFKGWIMLNLYPQRATKPDDMDQERSEDLHRENLLHIEKVFKRYPKATLWAAWGASINKRKFLAHALKDIAELARKHDCRWVAISKKTKDGHPRHPLYLSATESLSDFDMDEYFKQL